MALVDDLTVFPTQWHFCLCETGSKAMDFLGGSDAGRSQLAVGNRWHVWLGLIQVQGFKNHWGWTFARNLFLANILRLQVFLCFLCIFLRSVSYWRKPSPSTSSRIRLQREEARRWFWCEVPDDPVEVGGLGLFGLWDLWGIYGGFMGIIWQFDWDTDDQPANLVWRVGFNMVFPSDLGWQFNKTPTWTIIPLSKWWITILITHL